MVNKGSRYRFIAAAPYSFYCSMFVVRVLRSLYSLLQSRIRCAYYENRMSAMALLDYVGKSAMKLCAGVMEVPRIAAATLRAMPWY